jgi:hypothetical protein
MEYIPRTAYLIISAPWQISTLQKNKYDWQTPKMPTL